MKLNPVILFLVMLGFFPVHVNAESAYHDKLVNTYSIVARDPATGELGVAVQSHWFSVGPVVPWAEAGVGAIATQSLVNISFGPKGLELLKSGKTAQEALDILIQGDEGRDFRQLAIIDAKGNVASYTGAKCIEAAGHQTGKNFSVQANLMLNNTVWSAMASAFEKADGPLAERMVAALEAAQSVGGDIRGKQSAAILIVRGNSTGNIWEDRLIDLRVEDHPEPVKEIKRLLQIQRAYEHMNNGDLAMEKNDIDLALKEYGAAQELFPENLEMRYWYAVSLANAAMVDRSLPVFKDIFEKDENWRTLTKRLPKSGLLTVSNEDLKRILSQN